MRSLSFDQKIPISLQVLVDWAVVLGEMHVPPFLHILIGRNFTKQEDVDPK